MKILVAQADAQARGGAEIYAARIVNALTQAGHAVGQVDVRGHQPLFGQPDPLLLWPGRSLWNWAQVCRALPRLARRYDAVVLAYGEGPRLHIPTLTIRHAPALFSHDPAMIAHLGANPGLSRQLYARGCRHLAGVRALTDGPGNDRHLTVANSRWTARQVAQNGEILCDAVLYPPLTAPPDLPASAERRPYAIVALSRIVANKRIEDAIALTDALRQRGYPATLTIIGRGSGPYADQIATLVTRRPHVTLLQNASDSDRSLALSRATLGFHGYRGEHFGIGVAEMILSGVVPLVHNSGGVCELVPERSLRFENLAEAVQRADTLLSRPDLTHAAALRLGNGLALGRALDFDRHAIALVDRWLAGHQTGSRDVAA